MAEVATGRERTAVLALNACERIELDVGPLTGGATFFQAFATSSAFQCALEVHVNDIEDLDIESSFDGVNYTYRYKFTMELEVITTLPGAIGSTRTTNHTGYTGYFVDPVLPTFPYATTGDFDGGPGIDGSLDVILNLQEFVASDWADPFNTLFEKCSDVTAEFAVSGSYDFIFATIAEGDQPLTINFSDTFSWDQTVTGTQMLREHYRAVLAFEAVKGLNNSLSIDCDGIFYTNTVGSWSVGNASLIGDVTDAEFDMSTTDEIGQGFIGAEPDWSVSAWLYNRTYETNALMSSVETEHYWGSTLLSTGSTGSHRYPTSGEADGYLNVNLADGVTSGDAELRLSRLFNVSEVSATSDGHWFKPSDAWGDSTGRGLNSWNYSGGAPAIYYPFFLTNFFEAGTLSLEDTHRYLFLDTASRLTWSGGGTLSQDGDFVKIDNTNGFGVLTLDGTQTPKALFLPFGYRYYRLRWKTDTIGRTITFKMRRKVNSTPQSNEMWWTFTSTTTDWETHEFDLAIPERFFNNTGAEVTPAPMVHPADWQLFQSDHVWQILPPSLIATSTDYWFDYIEGFHQSGGDQYPALLIGSCECTDQTPRSDFAPDITSEVCSASYSPPAAGSISGGTLFGRLVTNGVMGLNLFVGDVSVSAALTAWQTTFGSNGSTMDTGVAFASAGHALGTQAQALNGWISRPMSTVNSIFPVDQDNQVFAEVTAYYCGYYGMGDPVADTYSPTLQLTGERTWDGELIGNLFEADGSLAGVPLALVNDDDSVIVSAESNSDGLFRLFVKYGVVKPFSNTGANCAARQEYTGTTPNDIVYTADGEDFNAYWAQSENLVDRDGSNYSDCFYTRDRWAVLDRLPMWRDFRCTPAESFHLDLIQTAGVPFWFRAFRSTADAIVERSLDAGATWDLAETVSGTLETGTNKAIPTLAATRWDDVLLAFHNASGETKIHLSTNAGETFTLQATHASLRYPRVVVAVERCWLGVHNGTRLEFYTSDDYLVTKTEVTALRITCPLQLCAFREDRRGYLHVLYEDAGGALQHVYSEAGVTWSSPVQIAASGEFPAWANNTPRALAVYWVGTTLTATRLLEDYNTIDGAAAVPSGTWKKGVMGLHQSSRDEFYLGGQIGALLKTRFTPDQAATWAEPV